LQRKKRKENPFKQVTQGKGGKKGNLLPFRRHVGLEKNYLWEKEGTGKKKRGCVVLEKIGLEGVPSRGEKGI